MANLIAAASGNFTSSGTWGAIDSTSELDSHNGANDIGTSAQDSSTFTPGAITVDGIALYMYKRSGSTGTLTVTLRNSSGSVDVASVTINVSDLPALTTNITSNQGCWVFFKFSSSQTLIAATNYLVRVVASNSGQVTFMTNGSTNNWCRKLRTTTTQAPASNNNLIICKERTGQGTANSITVTMDNTANTTFGASSVGVTAINVCDGGTLTFGTSASTNYYFRWRGLFMVVGNGTVNVGTSGTPIPSSSTAVLEADCSSNGDSGFQIDWLGTFNVYGAAKTPWTRLTADAASSATSFSAADTTGWASGDSVVLSPTDSSRDHHERLTLNSVSTGAFGTSGGSSFAHSGTAPLAAYVLNLTRNVKLRSVSTSNRGYFYQPNTGPCTVHIEYLEVDASSWGLNNSHQFCFAFENTGTTGGTATVKYSACNPSVADGGNCVFFAIQGGCDNFFLEYNVSYDWAQTFIAINNGGTINPLNCSVKYNVQIKQKDGTACFYINNTRGLKNWVGNVSISHKGGNFAFEIELNISAATAASSVIAAADYDGNEAWYSDGAGWFLQMGVDSGTASFAFSTQNCKAIRNAGSGWFVQSCVFRLFEFINYEAVGNASGNTQNAAIHFRGVGNMPWLTRLINCTLAGDTTVSSTFGILTSNTTAPHVVRMELINTTFGKSSGIRNAFTDGNIAAWVPAQGQTMFLVKATNCYWGGGGAYTDGGPPGVRGAFSAYAMLAGDHIDGQSSYVTSQDHQQVTGDHRLFPPQGTLQKDTTIHNTTPAQSLRMTPSTASYKLRSPVQEASIASGHTRTVQVKVRKNVSGDSSPAGAAYNGNQPRLVLRRNDSIGVTSDTVLATASASAGTWETLSGTTPTASQDGGIEVFVDCDGTAGWVNAGEWSVT